MHFCIVAKHCFPNGVSRFSNVAKTHHGTLIILMVFASFEVAFRKMASYGTTLLFEHVNLDHFPVRFFAQTNERVHGGKKEESETS